MATSIRAPYPLLCILALAAPASATAQGTPRPMPYEDVLEFALLESPAHVLRDVSTGNHCFDFDLTPERQQELRSAAQRRDPYAQPTALDPVFAYIQSRPCRPPQTSTPPSQSAVAPPHPIYDRGQYLGVIGDADLLSSGQGFGLQVGGWAARTVDAVLVARYSTYNGGTILDETASYFAVAGEFSLRWWLFPDETPLAIYLQGGVAAQADRWESESYLGRYAGAGVTGGGGAGVFVTSRVLLSIDYQGQRLWSLNEDEQGFTSKLDGGFQAALVRLGITRFW